MKRSINCKCNIRKCLKHERRRRNWAVTSEMRKEKCGCHQTVYTEQQQNIHVGGEEAWEG
jgi:hypothetical protein